MIISHKYKFIFIKTRKTGGSSVEKILLDYLSGTDYIFGSMWPEGMPPHNLTEDREHADWRWIKNNYPLEWNNYFKFAVDRNPWDRFVSKFHWWSETKPEKVRGGFAKFLKKNYNTYLDWNQYANGNTIMVDKLVKFEDMKTAFYNLPIPYNGELETTFLKKTKRPKDYRPYYNDETKNLVSKSCKNIIDYFEYKF